MIEINITNCPDPEFKGLWKFNKNQIYFGYPQGDISPEGLPSSFAFMLEVFPDFIQVQPHPKLEFWLLNGKRATKARKVKCNDTLQVGEVEFKVIETKFEEVLTKKQLLDKKLKNLVANESPVLNIIQLLNPKTK
jgi:hypothetical protein